MKKHIFIFVGGPRTGKSKLANFIDPCRDIKVHDDCIVEYDGMDMVNTVLNEPFHTIVFILNTRDGLDRFLRLLRLQCEKHHQHYDISIVDFRIEQGYGGTKI